MNEPKTNDTHANRMLALLLPTLGGIIVYAIYSSFNTYEKILVWLALSTVGPAAAVFFWDRYSIFGREKRKRLEAIREIPPALLLKSPDSIFLGTDITLKIPIYLPNEIRTRHVHIIGATGTGKTMSTLYNFIEQDVARGYGAIILDGKGDVSFLNWLNKTIPAEKLRVFDLSDEKSLAYNPLAAGSAIEAAQRLYSSLTWSETYYAAKARSVLQLIFQKHFILKKKNPSLLELAEYLETPNRYISIAASPTYPAKLATQDYVEIAGLRDQINSLCTGHLANILSPNERPEINLADAQAGKVLYFRLQSSLSPQIAATTGKLLINHLNFLAGTAHRGDGQQNKAKLVPVYLDEFATFACPEFADLISKARSAGYALHFSHQSIGDIAEVSQEFVSRITDNSATKIVMRVNDPDSAEYFARSFGTKVYQKVTQRITNARDVENAELIGEGSSRDARKYRASPDEMKSHPTGVGSVLIAHGYDAPQGAASVFKIRFPDLSEARTQI